MCEYIKGNLFDYALLVGMNSDEYWFGNPSFIWNYINAYEEKTKYDLQMVWLQGVYFQSALGSTQVWTVSPFKNQDWAKMPQYAKNPLEKESPKTEVSAEKKALIAMARTRLASLGYLEN